MAALLKVQAKIIGLLLHHETVYARCSVTGDTVRCVWFQPNHYLNEQDRAYGFQVRSLHGPVPPDAVWALPDDYLCINPNCLKWWRPADDDELFSNNEGSFCSADCQTEYDEWDT